jgi:lipopolysaccharide assembly outer membrane protein LptD (OstA)
MRSVHKPAAVILLLLGLLPTEAPAQEEAEPQDRSAAESEQAPPEAGEEQPLVAPGPGGVTLEIAAGPGSVFGKDELILKEYVDIRYGDLRLQADFVRYLPATKVAYAEGNVIIDQGEGRITAQSVEYNLETNTGIFIDARGTAEPGIIFVAEKVEKISENELVLHDARFTACTQPIPYWSFKMRRALLRLGEYAYLHNLTFRAGRVPVFYSPYLVWPIKTDRASGFLFPQFGFSERNGTVLSQGYFWAMRRNMDATIYLDYLSKAGWGVGTEYRYVVSETGRGGFRGYFIRDEVAEQSMEPGVPVDRWVVNYQHRQQIGLDWNLVSNVNLISDFDYFQDFARDIRLASTPEAVSNLFLSRNWGFYSLNMQAERREQLVQEIVLPTSYGQDFVLPTREKTIVRWIRPEAELRGRRHRLGRSPLYLSLLSSANNFEKGEKGATYQRVDAFPTLSSQLSPVPWLDIDASAGVRDTYYTKSSDPDPGCDNIPGTGDWGEGNGKTDDREKDIGGTCTAGVCTVGLVGDSCTVDSDCGILGVFGPEDDIGCDGIPNSGDIPAEGNGRRDVEGAVIVDDPINRRFQQAGMTLIGPKLSRVFNTPSSRFSPRYKNTIEPTLRYTYQSRVGNPDRVIQFDEIDRLTGDVNRLSYAFVTRLFAKRPMRSTDPTQFLPPAGVDFIGGSSDPLAGVEEQLRRELAQEDAEKRAGMVAPGDEPDAPPEPPEPEMTTVEIVSLEISQDYSFLRPLSTSGVLKKERQVSDIRAILRFNPSLKVSVDARTNFDVLFKDLRNASLSANLRSPGRGFLDVTWSLVRDLEARELSLPVFDRNQIGLNAETNLFNRRFLLGAQINYELGDVSPGQPRLRDQRYKLGYNTQCCGFQFEFLNRNYTRTSQSEFRFLINLRGVGNVIDLHSTTGGGGF